MNKSLRARLLGSPDYVHETRCPAKERRHASKRAFLMKVRKLLGLAAPPRGNARVYSCMGGPAVEGEVTLRTANWFVQLSKDYSYGRLESDEVPRNMGPNCPIPASCLARPEDLADWIRRQNWPLPCQHPKTDVFDDGDIVCMSCQKVVG